MCWRLHVSGSPVTLKGPASAPVIGLDMPNKTAISAGFSLSQAPRTRKLMRLLEMANDEVHMLPSPQVHSGTKYAFDMFSFTSIAFTVPELCHSEL